MKTIVIGDIHGLGVWKDILSIEGDFDEVIFIGDYVDSFDIHASTQITNLLDIIQFKTDNPDKVKLLIGNHDYSYWPGGQMCSGFQGTMHTVYDYLYEKYQDKFQLTYFDKAENIMYSHAGITKTFRDSFGASQLSGKDLSEYLNDVFELEPEKFKFNYIDKSQCGNHIAQGCLWIRPPALAEDHIDGLQIVGHTHGRTIRNDAIVTDFYVVDALPYQYLTILDGDIVIKNLKTPQQDKITFDI